MPTVDEINMYFRKFCDKYDLDVEKFNAVGHQAPIGEFCGAMQGGGMPGQGMGGQGMGGQGMGGGMNGGMGMGGGMQM